MICWLAPQTAMAATAEFACKPKHWCHITIKKQVCSDYDVGRMAKRLLFISTQGVWLDKRKHHIETVENMQAVLDQEALIEAAREKAAEEQAAKEHAAKIKAAIDQISGIAPSADQASDDGISDELGQPRVSMQLREEAAPTGGLHCSLREGSLSYSRRTLHVKVFPRHERQHKRILELVLPNHALLKHPAQRGRRSGRPLCKG